MEVANEDNSQAWVKALAFNKVGDHIYDRNAESPGAIFNVKLLEKMHSNELESNGTYITFYETSFSTRLTNSIDGLIVKSADRTMLAVCFDEALDVLGAPQIPEKLRLSVSKHLWANSD